MNIGFIGAGKVGTSFGAYIKNIGFRVTGYYDIDKMKAEEASSFVGVHQFNSLDELMKESQVVFITTGDSYIKDLAKQLWEKGLVKDEHILVNMSGALSSQILKDDNKGNAYSLHPLQSFADIEKSVKDLKDTYFSLEGEVKNEDPMIEMLKRMGNPYFILEENQKSRYHMSACVFSNYLTTLMDFGTKILLDIGIDSKVGFMAMKPLIEGTLKNIENLGTEKALTGPISRGDSNTIKDHLKNFHGNLKDYEEMYKLLGIKTLELAEKEKLKDEQKIQKLNDILK